MDLQQLMDSVRNKTEKHSLALLRISTGIIYIWFGILKFFPDRSPAEAIVSETLGAITFGWLEGQSPVVGLGIVEIAIGFSFIVKKLRFAVPIMYFQMLGTVLPLFLFIEKTWELFPVIPTLLGQYIIKNLVFIAAAILLGATERGAKLITDPTVARQARKKEKEKEAEQDAGS